MRQVNFTLSAFGFLGSCFLVTIAPEQEALAGFLFTAMFILGVSILISHRSLRLGRKEIFAGCPFLCEVIMWGLVVLSLLKFHHTGEGMDTGTLVPLYWMLGCAAYSADSRTYS